MSKVVVIGGGASGLVAAIKASFNNEVIILESNDKCGKKILLTGNGKCNYWNSDINIGKYYTDNFDVLKNIISDENQKEVLSFLESLGIYPKIKNGYYYPYSNQASSIRTLLIDEVERRNIKIIYDFKVENIIKTNNSFIIKSNNEELVCDKVIIATGSYSYPKTGSDGSGYKLVESLGHSINTLTPSLVPLKGNENYFKDWEGVRGNSKISLFINNEKVKEEIGEIQLTDYGISGICTFNISGLATKYLKLNNQVYVRINFMPDFDDFYDWFETRNNNISNHTIEQLLESIIPYKLMFVLLKKAGIDKNSYWNSLREEEKRKFVDQVQNFYLEITDYHSFDRSQVTTGGVSLNDINPNTFESNITEGLYLVGEILDVDGNCGGFNLAFAFISGYLAGRGIK